jgi:hypothetical protein
VLRVSCAFSTTTTSTTSTTPTGAVSVVVWRGREEDGGWGRGSQGSDAQDVDLCEFERVHVCVCV